MKASIAISLIAAAALACSYGTRSSQTASAPTAPRPAERVETAQVSESAPPEPGIPTNNPSIAPPIPPAAVPPDQTPLTLTPASGVGTPRTASAQLVPASDASRDAADSAQDQESIREIRAALASNRELASVAPQVTIVARKGRVWLRGQVNTPAQRAAMEKAARQAAGVINVNNELNVMQ